MGPHLQERDSVNAALRYLLLRHFGVVATEEQLDSMIDAKVAGGGLAAGLLTMVFDLRALELGLLPSSLAGCSNKQPTVLSYRMRTAGHACFTQRHACCASHMLQVLKQDRLYGSSRFAPGWVAE